MREQSFGIIPLKKENSSWMVFLVLLKKGGHWGFPKGHANLGETPLETAKRELQEETGLLVEEVLHNEPIVESYQFYKEKTLVLKEVSYFLSRVKGEIQLQEIEIQEGKWVFLEKALEILTFPEGREVCRKVIKML